MQKLSKILQTAGLWVNMAGLVALAFMMVLTVADVLMRYCFRSPLPGASELTELMLVIIVFFALADTHTVRGHVAVDLVVTRLAPRASSMRDCSRFSLKYL